MRALVLPGVWPLLFVSALLLIAACGDGSDETDGDQGSEPDFVGGEVGVIPRPAEVWIDAGGSHFAFTGSARVLVEPGHPELRAAAEVLHELIAPHLPGRAPIGTHAGERAPRGALLLTTRGADAGLGDEGYELVVTQAGGTLRVHSGRGALHGVQTLRQLLPPEVESAEPMRELLEVPSVRIVDRPRFAWRGFMLDVSRTFFPIDYLHRWLELLALHKLSVFHLHLTDDQGWRIEIQAFPELHQLASRFDAERFPDERGGYYTQDELRGLVAHAQRLGIEIVPEIDLPGHSLALLHALPELACRAQPDLPRAREEFSIHPWAVGPLIHEEIVCACDERVYGVLEAILDEVFDIFPSRWVHLGGDEVPKAEWERTPLCEQYRQENGLLDFEHVQAAFTKRMEQFLAARGRTLIGWDETLAAAAHGDDRTQLAPETTIMHWRNFAPDPPGLYDRPVVKTPFTALYLDYYTFPLARAYAYEPVPDGLTPAQEANVLGAQGNMWTGYASQRTEERVDVYVFPKLAALAELTWSPRQRRDYEDFLARYPEHQRRLEILGVNTEPCDDCLP
jgi:hexosaminidase